MFERLSDRLQGVFSGLSSAALSAMKCTPQKTITSLSVRAASIDSARESPVT